MRALVQRVREGRVDVGGAEHGRIGHGFVILLGVRHGDTGGDASALADRCVALRVFDDVHGKMNLSLREVRGEALVIPQFTLYGDTRRGHRPGFTEAARPEEAEPLYETFLNRMRTLLGSDHVAGGVFGAHMIVTLQNDGPVTVLLERPDLYTLPE